MLTADFSLIRMGGRRQCNVILNVRKENNCQPKILQVDNKDISDTLQLRYFVTDKFPGEGNFKACISGSRKMIPHGKSEVQGRISS